MPKRRLVKSRVGRIRPSSSGYSSAIAAQMKKIEENFAKVLADLEGVTSDALVYGLQPAFDLSQRFVPVKEGTLKDSGYLVGRNFRGKPVVEIGYARGGSPDYAIFVHENLEAQHSGETQAKFLERALQQEGSNIGPRIAGFLKRKVF